MCAVLSRGTRGASPSFSGRQRSCGGYNAIPGRGRLLRSRFTPCRHPGDQRPVRRDLQFETGITGRIDVLPTAEWRKKPTTSFGGGFRASVTCPFGSPLGWRCFRDGHLVLEELAAADMTEDVLNGCL